MTFAYRLLGNLPGIEVAVEPRNMDKEMLWRDEKLRGDDQLWKKGQVFLGISSEFRVSNCNDGESWR